MPRHVSRESDAVISPNGSGSSNIMKLLRRAMDACGIAITDARCNAPRHNAVVRKLYNMQHFVWN